MNNINYTKKDKKIFISYISKEYNISNNVLGNILNNSSDNIEEFIKLISKEYNIPEKALNQILDKLFNNTSYISKYNINKCNAIIGNGNQCSCSKNTNYGEGKFCKTHYNLYENKCFIDIFAGSGSLGLEAISRGARFSYFFENNSEVLKVLKKNCIKICKEKNYEIILDDIFYLNFSKINIPISTIFIDPPYNINPFQKILNNIKNSIKLNVSTKIVLESHKNTIIELPSDYIILNQKIFGKTKIIFLKFK